MPICPIGAKYEAVEHIVRDFHHPYPHPKQPGLTRDHRAKGTIPC